MPGKHARLAASAAARWMECAGSVEAAAGKDRPTIYAAQGTFAHHIAAECLSRGEAGRGQARHGVARQETNSKPEDWLGIRTILESHEVSCDAEMVTAVQLYLDEVRGQHQAGDQTWVEMPLLEALQQVDPDMGGTADHVRYRPAAKLLRVTDFKYGAGKFVEATGNRQLRIYALGALLAVGKPVHTVEVCVVQPRIEYAEPVRVWSFSAAELLDFIADLRETAERTRQADAPLVPGAWCNDTFCPAARDCPALTAKQHQLMAARFGELAEYDPAALAEALKSVAAVKAKIKALEAFAYAEASRGIVIPGFKLVDKRPTRRWRSTGDVIEWAQEHAIDPYAPRELLSPAQLEKVVAESAPRGKKAEAKTVLAPFIESVSSGTALVPDGDDRAPTDRQVTADSFEAIPAANPLNF